MKRLLYLRIPLSSLTIGRLIAALSILGIGGLCYVCGAAVMFFQLPSCDFLDKAFRGARAWRERGRSTIPLLDLEEVDEFRKMGGIRVDKAEETWDGFTLYTTTSGAQATLIDMRGTVVHQWDLPFRRAWPHAPHVKDPLPDDQIHWFRCYLYSNGDLLAIYHGDGDSPYGYGLVKLDKDSNLLWAYANNIHHDVDVDEDGTIYTLAQQIISEPPPGLEFLPAPYGADSLVILSPEGRELETIPLTEAFANSPYALMLATDNNVLTHLGYGPTATPAAISSTPPRLTMPKLDHKSEFLHTNSVKVLKKAQAAKFPLFHGGQVLLSMRNLNTIAVLDRPTRSVAWAARGIWKAQHDAEFLDNGHLLLYDNYGTQRHTRVVEYDPQTQAIPWVYSGENSTSFVAFYRGMKQRLPNGNTLIVDPDSRRLIEVTRDKELVWENVCSLPAASPGQRLKRHAVTSAQRYSADELTFLNGVTRARP